MTEHLTISVITPSMNQGSFVQRTIVSVLSQGLNPNEYDYIVCDGGSTDETVMILQQYADRLRWVSEPDGGQADAVNKGIAMTSGEIIAWINSDDIYYPGTLKTVQAFFAEHPEVEILYGDADHIDAVDRILEPYPTEPWNYKRLTETCYLCQPAVFFRRSLVEKLGPLNPALQYCMDYELWLRWGREVSFHHLPRKLAGSRLHDQTKTLSQRSRICLETNQMLQKQLGSVPSKWLWEYAHVQTETTMGSFYRSLWNPTTQILQRVEWMDHLIPPETQADQQDLHLTLAAFTSCRQLEYAHHLEKCQFVNHFVYHSLWAFWHWHHPLSLNLLAQLLRIWLETHYISLRKRCKTAFSPLFKYS